ncbi:MAG: tRNA lysidine(34) synthetase TilS, partial [Bdellovibrionales bacterium]|nr:tRNA lysidine(34) synthetase TilS [Bdellovibrionales bacterium]
MTRGRITPRGALEEWFERGGSYLLAVSGGIDSMALLHAAASLKDMRDLRIGVCHINHRFRPDSDEDESFVAQICNLFEVPCFLTKLSPDERSGNLEGWAREKRYEILTHLREKEKFDFIVTAHNADDVAETLLMRLLSNKELGSIHRYDSARCCVRPFLEVSREEMNTYVRENGIAFREDPTNKDTSYLRNRVRHNVMPLLREQFDNRATEVLSQRAMAIADDIGALYEYADRAVAELGSFQWGSETWLRAFRKKLIGMPKGAGWRAVERALEYKIGMKVGRKHGLAALEVITAGRLATELPGG